MNSRQAQKKLFALSVDSLPPEMAAEVRRLIAECPECEHEWVMVERTILTLSTASQPIVTAHQTQTMWHECQNRLQQSQASQQLAAGRAAHQSRGEARQPGFFSFLSRPSWGWAALGASAATFAVAWFLVPRPQVATQVAAQPLPQPSTSLVVASRDTPISRDAAPLVEHHAAIDMSPWGDPVGATLVSHDVSDTVNASRGR